MSKRPNEKASTADFEFAALREARNYRQALVREFAPHLSRRVLEVGAGIGQINELLQALPGVKELLALEPDVKFCAEFRKLRPNQRLLEGTVEALSDPGPWHGIISINVLEHILEDERELPPSAARRARAALSVCPCATGNLRTPSLHISQTFGGAPVCDRLYGLPMLKAGH